MAGTPKKIGFIDDYLDNWHADSYPGFIAKSAFGGNFKVALAWEKRPNPASGKNADQWCREHSIPKATSMEQVIRECDCLVVLSPKDAAPHEELADLPLQSGKPLYIDKPFAPSAAAARRMFAKAAKHGTPMYSSSALRFGSELHKALTGTLKNKPIQFVSVRGGGNFREYAIHQIEMLVMCLGIGAQRVMHVGRPDNEVLVVDHGDGRRGVVHVSPQMPFSISIGYLENNVTKTLLINEMNDFFPRFIDAMLTFFDTQEPPVAPEQTLEIAAILEAGVTALDRPEVWVPVPK